MSTDLHQPNDVTLLIAPQYAISRVVGLMTFTIRLPKKLFNLDWAIRAPAGRSMAYSEHDLKLVEKRLAAAEADIAHHEEILRKIAETRGRTKVLKSMLVTQQSRVASLRALRDRIRDNRAEGPSRTSSHKTEPSANLADEGEGSPAVA